VIFAAILNAEDYKIAKEWESARIGLKPAQGCQVELQSFSGV